MLCSNNKKTRKYKDLLYYNTFEYTLTRWKKVFLKAWSYTSMLVMIVKFCIVKYITLLFQNYIFMKLEHFKMTNAVEATSKYQDS